nr:probable protein phosphatase 2C 25 [Tanacetum cinerariifolium]
MLVPFMAHMEVKKHNFAPQSEREETSMRHEDLFLLLLRISFLWPPETYMVFLPNRWCLPGLVVHGVLTLGLVFLVFLMVMVDLKPLNLQHKISKTRLKRVKQGSLNAHYELFKQEQRGGACCVTAIIHSWNLVVLNASDSRAVVCNGGVAEASVSSLS